MPTTESGYLSAAIHQATGMVAAQLNCDPPEALGRLRIAAAASERTLDEMAKVVLDRGIEFKLR